MRVDKKCLPCVLNQMTRVCDFAGLTPDTKNKVMTEVHREMETMHPSNLTSPEFSEKIYRVFTRITGLADPYHALRKEQNDMVLERLPALRTRLAAAPDPLYTAAVYALLGNIIDYGGVRLFDTREIFEQSEKVKLAVNDFAEFKERLSGARKVLIIGDNAGEAVFDLLFIEEMKKFNPGADMFFAVRSAPAINDVILKDAYYIGIDRVAHVLETGATFAGTRLGRSSREFLDLYDSADLVISKGQGNFETLEMEKQDILFAFKVKCEVVACFVQIELGSLVFAFSRTLGLPIRT